MVPLLQYLRPSFIVGFVVTWNAIFFAAFRLDGGSMDRQFHAASAALLAALGPACLAFFGLGALAFSNIRFIVLRPTVELAPARFGLIFVGILGLLGTASLLVTAFNNAR